MKIVFDPFNPYDEKIFDYRVAKENYIGATWIPLLYQECKEEGCELLLAKRYLSEGIFSPEDLIISEGVTDNTKELLKTPARPFILYNGESPNVDWKFYTLLKHYSKRYKYAFLFDGCRNHIDECTKFKTFLWPNDINALFELNSFFSKRKEKKLVMIAANKKQSSSLKADTLKGIAKKAGINLLTTLVPSMRLKDLYSYRLKAIQYFSSKAYFQLFGRHWENHSNLNRNELKAVKKLSPTGVSNKYDVLSEYQFALCFENCIYPGYITEKIFDCFISGCIPVYLGAPDIEKYIPTDLFVDMRSFEDFTALAKYIEQCTPEEIKNYQERIANYLQSETFENFTDVFFTKSLLKLIREETLLNKDKIKTEF